MEPARIRTVLEAHTVALEFEGDIKVVGEIITGKRNLHGEILLICFRNCKVTHGDTVLFRPEWGNYDMAVGQKLVSAFSGPADVGSFDLISHVPSSKTIKAKHTAEKDDLEVLYQTVRSIRESNDGTTPLEPIFEKLQNDHPNDWLLAVELVELLYIRKESYLMKQILLHLENLKEERPEFDKLMTDGLDLIFEGEDAVHLG
jgi:phenylalanine-4-hydroxylase